MAVTAQVESAPSAHRSLVWSRARRRPDRWVIVILTLFAALSIWVLAHDLWQVAGSGRVWTGTDGIFPGDQLQYMAWVREASHHLLISDAYVLRATPHDYLEPLIALAGGLTALGLAPWAALLVFQPLVVAAIVLAVLAYLYRSLTGRWERRAALILALFSGPFVILTASFRPVAAEWLPFWMWGYIPGALAVAALVGALVAYDRTIREGRAPWLAPTLGLLASWLHPWQGEELLLILLVYELGRRTPVARRYLEPEAPPGRTPSALPWLTALATLAPLIYYVLLDRLDPIWHLAQAAAALHKSPEIVLLPLLPLLLAAAPGWRGRPQNFLVATSRIWPLAAVAVYGLGEAGLGSTPRHALAGITIPLAVLIVSGARGLGLGRIPRYRWLAALLVAAATVPVALAGVRAAPGRVSSAFIDSEAHSALSYLARDPQPGGVLTTQALGQVTPGMTGRLTYIGDMFWSVPDPTRRQRMVRWLFYHHPGRLRAQRFVLATGARFVLAPCGVTTDLRTGLGPLLSAVHRFGCATVYTLRARGQAG